MAITGRELQQAERRYKAAMRRAEQAREQRQQTIGQALREGWTLARIADATGMTRGRLGQLAPALREESGRG